MAQSNLARRPRDIGLLIRRFFVFALPAIVLAGFFGTTIVMSAFKSEPEKEEDTIKAMPVVAVVAISKPVTLSVISQGEATPRTRINLASNVSGRIAYVAPIFIEGGAFKKNDVLIRIEDEEYRYRVVQARANVAQAQSRHASEAAEAELARIEFADLGGAKASPLTLREPQMAEAGAMLASAKAVLSEAELQLRRAQIKAPFDGRVTERLAGIGEFVTPGSPLGRIFSTRVMEIKLALTDNQLAQLDLPIGYAAAPGKGPSVRLTSIVAGRPCVWEGRIVRTDSGFDPATRVLFAYVSVDDPYGAGADNGVPLAAGLFVSAEIDGRMIEDAVLVPRTAVRGDGQVFIARDDNTLEIRNVTIAKSDPAGAVLTAGLRAGERVITSPVRAPLTGMAISVAGAVGEGAPEPTVAPQVATSKN